MISYAGIGSRSITKVEDNIIRRVANKLSEKFVLYSGNAEGSDNSFQKGSNGNCVLMLPWKKFNFKQYSGPYLDALTLGDTFDGIESVYNFHPAPERLGNAAMSLMSRNYHQIHGFRNYPKVSFVMCCADEDAFGVKGGTGQAVRIAKSDNIPVINIRNKYWLPQLKEVCKTIIKDKK